LKFKKKRWCCCSNSKKTEKASFEVTVKSSEKLSRSPWTEEELREAGLGDQRFVSFIHKDKDKIKIKFCLFILHSQLSEELKTAQ